MSSLLGINIVQSKKAFWWKRHWGFLMQWRFSARRIYWCANTWLHNSQEWNHEKILKYSELNRLLVLAGFHSFAIFCHVTSISKTCKYTFHYYVCILCVFFRIIIILYFLHMETCANSFLNRTCQKCDRDAEFPHYASRSAGTIFSTRENPYRLKSTTELN